MKTARLLFLGFPGLLVGLGAGCGVPNDPNRACRSLEIGQSAAGLEPSHGLAFISPLLDRGPEFRDNFSVGPALEFYCCATLADQAPECAPVDCTQPGIQGGTARKLGAPHTYDHERSTGFGLDWLVQLCMIGVQEERVAAVWSNIYRD